MFEWFVNNLLWSQGLKILAVVAALSFIGIFKWRIFLYLGIFIFIFSLYFFRNPARSCPEAAKDPNVLVCPADGKIIEIKKSETNEFDGYAQKVSIFLSVFDVHVNRVPMSGILKNKVYKAGKFLMAFLPKSSELNERNDIEIVNEKNDTILVRQIAGTIARTICCWLHKGYNLTVGEAYGMIKFGSRVEILLPKNFSVEVKKDQHVYGGKTVLGRLYYVEEKNKSKDK